MIEFVFFAFFFSWTGSRARLSISETSSCCALNLSLNFCYL